MKRIIYFILALIISIGGLPLQVAAQDTAWKELYRTKIQEICSNNNSEMPSEFLLVDIDWDNIPELFELLDYGGESKFFKNIYSVYDNRIIDFKLPETPYSIHNVIRDGAPVYFNKNTGQSKVVCQLMETVISWGGGNEYFMTEITKNNQDVKFTQRFKYKEEAYDDFNSVVEKEKYFYFDMQQNKWIECTKSEYDKQVRQYYSSLEHTTNARGKYILCQKTTYHWEKNSEWWKSQGYEAIKLDMLSEFLDGFKGSEPSEWAKGAVAAAIAADLVPDQLLNRYQSNITRNEFCKLAIRYIEVKSGLDIESFLTSKNLNISTNIFTDTQDANVIAAYALGITSGVGDNRFNPNGMITREQAATMLTNVAAALDVDTKADKVYFADESQISNWADSSIAFVASNKIMNGTGNNKFSPKSLYTREQAIITFFNMSI